MNPVKIIGGGLAGSEAAWQLSIRGHHVQLYEMRPLASSKAHRTGKLAELVCSNSLKSQRPDRAGGLLKEELRICGSFLLKAAENSAVPGGSALCVDRNRFAGAVTEALEREPLIDIVRQEVRSIPIDGPVIVATGPLTTDSIAFSIGQAIGNRRLFFYDAIAPVIEADSINWNEVFIQDRYQDASGSAYVNCPLDKEQYLALIGALREADPLKPHDFEDIRYFEACMPIEELASRGDRTLAYGSWRPTGLIDPRTGKRPYAVIQLRPENVSRTAFGMVGFQTRLRFPDQERIFRTIPGLGCARFERLGTIHRNTYLDSPACLDRYQRASHRTDLFFAGQVAGVEGYVESMASGLMAGLYTASMLEGKIVEPPPAETMIGAILARLSDPRNSPLIPVNAQFGLLPPLPDTMLKKDRKREVLAKRALKEMERWIEEQNVECRPWN
ncbi:MAG: methylenetetrahydrofolate--tRNA-(uracil(54)-C(5))-methyltransferase (FADH(2)-oxidizing) TrmFO [Pseudomonadota bacterium]|jgi:methylenetetrahydrofolate--tRNA-(uracil-5-)-methyltransferase